jgi:hypothetical protein
MITVSYIMNVLNGEPFIQYQLDSIFQYAHEIIIVEGAYKKFKHAATTDGRSTDKTIEIIQNYPDPENKIKLIMQPGFYDDRLDMCNELLKHVTGDVVWQVDVDEFFYPETHEYIRRQFEEDEQIDRVSFNFIDFYGPLKYYIKGYEWIGLNNVNRVHRFTKGDQWISQRPPQLKTKSGQLKRIKKHIDGDCLESKNHLMYHGTMLFEKQIIDKYKYYNEMWGDVYYSNKMIKKWKSYKNKFFAAGLKKKITWFSPYKGEVPESLEKLKIKLLKQLHSKYKFIETENIDIFFKTKNYQRYENIAMILSEYSTQERGKDKFISKALFLIKEIFFNLDMYTGVYALKILFLSIFRHIKIFLKDNRALKSNL